MNKKLPIIILSAILSLTSIMTSCGNSKTNIPDESHSGEKPKPNIPENEEINHENEERDTEGYVLYNGMSDYKIVIPENALPMEAYAAGEFQELFAEATGVRLQITTDAETTEEEKIFSLGRTKPFGKTGVKVDNVELRADGYKMFTKDDDVYLCGGEDTGTLYAVYEYLGRTLGFEQYYVDCYALNKNVKEIALKEYNVTERPDIGYRSASYGYMLSDSKVARRMRISGGYFSNLTAVKGQACHNCMEWLPLEDYYDEHPKWYSNDKTQVCYTAHGDAMELEKMLNAALETFKGIYASNPNMKAIAFTINDYTTFCTCDACSAEQKKYNTNSAVCLKFCNRLSKKMENYVRSLHSDDSDFVYDIDLAFFAYFSTTAAPVIYDEKADTYTPIDSSVVCDEHVVPWYAPVYMDYTHSIYDESNVSYLRNMLGWSAISSKMFLWTYDTNFRAYLAPYDTFDGMQDLFKLMASINTAYNFNQSQYNQQTAGAAWHNLKAYLTAKLMWNSDADLKQLTDGYFDAMYGPASETMKLWFNSQRAYIKKLMSEGKYQGSFSIYTDAYTADYWSYSILKSWQKYAEEAMNAIEKFEDVDPELYAKYYGHIAVERITTDYLMLELYESRLDTDEARTLFNRIKSDCKLCGITRLGEGKSFMEWANGKVLID